ncbi:MAG: pilus assembly protein PilM [Gammaproteobacteria bacterium]
MFGIKMLGITRKGPIGLDFGSDHLKMVQADFVKGNPVIRSAIVMPYPTNKKDLYESPADLKKMIREARSKGGFHGNRAVVTMPPEKLQFVSLEYKCMPSKDPDEAVIEAIKERFGDQIKSSVIDFLHIRPEHKEQIDRTALAAVAQKSSVVSFLELIRKSGLDVDRLEIGPVAINRLMGAINPNERDQINLVINFGLYKSYATVLWGRRLLLDRELSFGCETGAKVLSEALEISKQEAKELLARHGIKVASKVVAGMDYDEVSIEETVADILKPVLQNFANEIKRLMLYVASRTRGRTVNESYMFGSVLDWPGVDRILSDMTGITFKTTQPFYGFATSKHAAKIVDVTELRGIAVATGLALLGLENKKGASDDA